MREGEGINGMMKGKRRMKGEGKVGKERKKG